MHMDILHKSFRWKATVCSLIALIMVISAGWAVLRQASSDYRDRATLYDVKIGDLVIPVEIADTPETLQKGLSGRLHLPKRHGMLFLFPNTDSYAFWMPNMNFPIDLLWVNESGRIVGIEESMLPEINMEKPHYYSPPEPVKYVIELNAGFVKKHAINVGQAVIIPDTSTGHRAIF